MIHSGPKNHKNKTFFSEFTPPISSPELVQTWVELSQSAITANALQFKKWLGPITQIAGVIKSNAYGHGLLPIATMYESCDSIASMCVINLSEAVYLRQNHIMQKPILVIGYLDAYYDLIIKYSIEVVLYDFEIALKLNEIGKKYKKQIIVHIKFDTGMSRLGIVASELNQFIDQVEQLSFVKIKGIFSHFAESYIPTTTHQQESVFAIALNKGYQTHISNSHASLTTEYKNYSFARIGIGLYGYLAKQSPEVQKLLKPVLSLKTRILQIKLVKAGSYIGYDSTYQATSDMKIAILAIGYTEGLDARLSNIGSVIINGQYAKIVGRVCMNLTIVDITTIKNAMIGQTVIILGSQANLSISVYDWAALTGASTYNHLTKLSHSLPRIITS